MNKKSENRTTPPAVKQRITVSGRNWNDIIKLPCFHKLTKRVNGHFVLELLYKHVRSSYAGSGIVFEGDTLVEYVDGTWGVERKKNNQDK